MCTPFLSFCRVPLTKVRQDNFLDIYRATLVNLKNKYDPNGSPEPLTDYKDVCCGDRTCNATSLAQCCVWMMCLVALALSQAETASSLTARDQSLHRAHIHSLSPVLLHIWHCRLYMCPVGPVLWKNHHWNTWAGVPSCVWHWVLQPVGAVGALLHSGHCLLWVPADVF